MLVRFLSYAASIIGARRYKPLLITGLALIFSVTSIVMVATALSGDSQDAASRAAQKTDKSGSSQQSTSQLNDLEKKTPKPNTQAPANNTPATGTNAANPTGNDTSNTNTPTLELSLNTSTVSLSQANAATAVSVSAAGSNNIQWSIAADTTINGLSARIDPAKDNAGNAVIRFVNDNAAAGTYQFIVTAKDAARSLSISKTLSVTIN